MTARMYNAIHINVQVVELGNVQLKVRAGLGGVHGDRDILNVLRADLQKVKNGLGVLLR